MFKKFIKELFDVIDEWVAFVQLVWEFAQENNEKRQGQKNESQSKTNIGVLSGLEHLDANNQANRIRIRNLIVEKCELAKQLPPRQKMIFLMYYDHGHTIKEIADLCGIDEGQVARRLRTG